MIKYQNNQINNNNNKIPKINNSNNNNNSNKTTINKDKEGLDSQDLLSYNNQLFFLKIICL